MKKISLLLGAGLVFLVSSCTVVYPGVATSNKIVKTGEVEAKLFLGLGNVDVGLYQAAKNGGITKIATYDYSVRAGLFTTKYEFKTLLEEVFLTIGEVVEAYNYEQYKAQHN